MKKILVLISVFVLISCQNEIAETSKESDHVNNDKGIINPLDPDMHVTCPWWPSPASSYQDPNIVYGKDYLVRNLTSDTIRVKMYILPKFAISPTNFVASALSLREAAEEFSYGSAKAVSPGFASSRRHPGRSAEHVEPGSIVRVS